MSVNIVEIIRKKRNGNRLNSKEIKYLVKSLTNGTMQDSQIGAFLMATYLNGLSSTETADLTREMVFSGDILKFNESWSSRLVDKHSTGGVGDKVSLILAPALAACNCKVPMISGRGLDFTGGTLDKLESIPGFNVNLNNIEMNKLLSEVGCFIASATSTIAPADKILYKHRDVTCTVDNFQLVISSIISKKVAEGCKYLVMDVKVGEASFFKNLTQARELSQELISVAEALGVKATAVLTEMNTPLGKTIGNSLEVKEAVSCLKNEGPSDLDDILETLGGTLLQMTGIAQTLPDGKQRIKEVIQNGQALARFQSMLIGQGVMRDVAHELCFGEVNKVLPQSKLVTNISSTSTGSVRGINALKIGKCCWLLGAGRTSPDQPIDHSVGVVLHKSVGDLVSTGETLLQVHHNEELDLQIKTDLISSFQIIPIQFSYVNGFKVKSKVLEILSSPAV